MQTSSNVVHSRSIAIVPRSITSEASLVVTIKRVPNEIAFGFVFIGRNLANLSTMLVSRGYEAKYENYNFHEWTTRFARRGYRSRLGRNARFYV